MTFIKRQELTAREREANGKAALAKALDARGYLLAYHRMLCTYDPDLMAAYDNYYRELTLLERAFTYFEREVVWLVLLTSAREAYGDIHMPRAEESGLTRDQIHDCMALAGVAEAYPAIEFSKSWSRWIAPEEADRRYAAMVATARGGIPEQIAEIALVVAHAARKCRAGMRYHLRRATELGAPIEKIAEGVSYVMLPCGGPTLVDACDVWAELAREGGCLPPWPMD
jgi:alkylhydroperoxidase/carboxymuconolactone decarboxylase family protein YurZ